ncbi:MAG: DNA adenine methylase [Desulfobulbaceae bacterium]|nr:DNA adenine methylase [Desulfobulbaceae bacterium]
MSIIPWLGGKGRLADTLLPLFPAHQCYVEPFAGGAALFFRKTPVKAEVLNDINGDIVNLYRVVQHHLEEFVRQFKWALTSRKLFEWTQSTPPETLTDIQRAARFYYLQKTCFGGHVENQTFGYATTSGPRLNLLRIEEELSGAHLRLAGAYIESMDWAEVVRRYDRDHTLFFCDPPYYGLAGYGVPFGLEQYQLMAALARSIKGRMVITVNDCPEMREAFSGLPIRETGIKYTCGVVHGERRESTELIILNREDGWGGQGRLF